MSVHCPLCFHPDSSLFHQDKKRPYWRCPQCALVFVAATDHLSAAAEKAQYDLHQNHCDDPGYRQFLNRLAKPLQQKLGRTGLSGLDFGCGPGPLLAQMLTEQGQRMAIWDPYFAPDPAPLNQSYDFISCSEAIEHFAAPAKEWHLWQRLLKPAAVLAIMTKRYIDLKGFANWHYKNDPTHISFFHEKTFEFLAQRDGFTVEFPAPDVVLLQKQN
ncbi:class I SAM-dependent methyltransferase [Rheinheimera sp.]|uniref:class I SAM-dependent methyltransferase n=1 Tax=Rheinheimera sp. TaxID=1869214 RepID=UPI00307E16F9